MSSPAPWYRVAALVRLTAKSRPFKGTPKEIYDRWRLLFMSYLPTTRLTAEGLRRALGMGSLGRKYVDAKALGRNARIEALGTEMKRRIVGGRPTRNVLWAEAEDTKIGNLPLPAAPAQWRQGYDRMRENWRRRIDPEGWLARAEAARNACYSHVNATRNIMQASRDAYLSQVNASRNACSAQVDAYCSKVNATRNACSAQVEAACSKVNATRDAVLAPVEACLVKTRAARNAYVNTVEIVNSKLRRPRAIVVNGSTSILQKCALAHILLRRFAQFLVDVSQGRHSVSRLASSALKKTTTAISTRAYNGFADLKDEATRRLIAPYVPGQCYQVLPRNFTLSVNTSRDYATMRSVNRVRDGHVHNEELASQMRVYSTMDEVTRVAEHMHGRPLLKEKMSLRMATEEQDAARLGVKATLENFVSGSVLRSRTPVLKDKSGFNGWKEMSDQIDRHTDRIPSRFLQITREQKEAWQPKMEQGLRSIYSKFR